MTRSSGPSGKQVTSSARNRSRHIHGMHVSRVSSRDGRHDPHAAVVGVKGSRRRGAGSLTFRKRQQSPSTVRSSRREFVPFDGLRARSRWEWVEASEISRSSTVTRCEEVGTSITLYTSCGATRSPAGIRANADLPTRRSWRSVRGARHGCAAPSTCLRGRSPAIVRADPRGQRPIAKSGARAAAAARYDLYGYSGMKGDRSVRRSILRCTSSCRSAGPHGEVAKLEVTNGASASRANDSCSPEWNSCTSQSMSPSRCSVSHNIRIMRCDAAIIEARFR